MKQVVHRRSACMPSPQSWQRVSRTFPRSARHASQRLKSTSPMWTFSGVSSIRTRIFLHHRRRCEENEAVEGARRYRRAIFRCSPESILCWADAAGKTVAQATLVFDLFANVYASGCSFVACAAHGAVRRRVPPPSAGGARERLVAAPGCSAAVRGRTSSGALAMEVRVRGVEIGKLTHHSRDAEDRLSDRGLTQYLTNCRRDQPGQTQTRLSETYRGAARCPWHCRPHGPHERRHALRRQVRRATWNLFPSSA